MGAHLQRAMVLFGQSRLDLAEGELRQELAQDADSPQAHAMLALCLASKEDLAVATEESRRAIELAPDMPFAHYVHAKVMDLRNRLPEALASIQEAIRLDPDDADYFAALASIQFQQRDWERALASSDSGLAVDADNVTCKNLRAMALVKLGRQDLAEAAIGSALEKDPENATTHANLGWTLLHRGDVLKALEHFREALRLDPQQEWARLGIIEALKARHIIYRVMLRYFLWMGRLSGQAQWAIIIGAYFGQRIAVRVARDNPRLAPFVWPIVWCYVAFVLMTWLADSLFNLLLRLSRFGRLVLSPDQITASNWLLGGIVLSLVWLVVWWATGDFTWGLAAIFTGSLTIPIAATFRCQPGWPRWVMAACSAALAIVGCAVVGPLIWFEYQTEDAIPSLAVQRYVKRTIPVLIQSFMWGILLSSIAGNALASVRPRK